MNLASGSCRCAWTMLNAASSACASGVRKAGHDVRGRYPKAVQCRSFRLPERHDQLRITTMRTSRWLLVAAASAALVLGLYAAGPGEFQPDSKFKGSSLTGWHQLGNATWKASNGVLTGTPTSADGGWLLLDKTFQDNYTFASFKAASGAKAGVLVRARKTAEGGLQGLLISLADGDLASYKVTLDTQGKELNREKLAAPAGRGGGGGAAAGRGPAAGAAAGAGGAGGRGGRGGPPPAALHPNDWNEVEILTAGDALRPTLNGNPVPAAVTGDNGEGYGSIALYAGGTGDVVFQEVSWKDLNQKTTQKEQVSTHFTATRISELYYGWSAAISDINHDGNADVVSGPFYYLGPDFTTRFSYRKDRVYNPGLEYAPDMVNFSADFNGDGWPDILASGFGDNNRPIDLYINPKGESRLWDHYRVLPTIASELVLMKDIDGDGKPEILYRAGGIYVWAKPDPANPTAVWAPHPISEQANGGGNHGMGVGDVNGDGRADFVTFNGWYEQPAKGAPGPWPFHAANFGSGGAEMGVYDINGDGLTDIITSVTAHDWGLNWYEQKKDAGGTITWVEHVIAGDYAAKNTGGVAFSELHGAAIADIDGDGIPDFVTGKRFWSHLENYNGPDPYGPPVVYVYRTVRNPKAPGGAEFVPELIHNRSGVGSTVAVGDLNKDGKPDVATAGAFGTSVFLSKPGAWSRGNRAAASKQ